MDEKRANGNDVRRHVVELVTRAEAIVKRSRWEPAACLVRRAAIPHLGRPRCARRPWTWWFAEEAFAWDAGDGVGDFDGAGFEVDLVPEDGECLAHADARAEHEGGQVGQIGLDDPLVDCEAPADEGDLFGGEGSGWVLGLGFDDLDFADRADGDGSVADGEFHHAGHDGAAGLGGGAPARSSILVMAVSMPSDVM